MIDAKRISGSVLARVPAPHREIQAANEGKEIVNDDDLLMLCRTERQAGIETKADAASGTGGEFLRRVPFSLGGIQSGEVPIQNVDHKLRFRFNQRFEEWSEHRRKTVVSMTGGTDELRLAVHVPTDDEHLALGEQQRCPQRHKVFGSIVQDRNAIRSASSPDSVVGDENGRRA